MNIQNISYILIRFQHICGASLMLTVYLQPHKRNGDRASGPSECAGARRASCLPTAYRPADATVGPSRAWSTADQRAQQQTAKLTSTGDLPSQSTES